MTLRTITFDDEQWQVVPKKMAPVMWHAAIAADDAIGAWAAALANAPEPPAQEPGTAAEIEALRAEVERLRADAARGRLLIDRGEWIRHRDDDRPSDSHALLAVRLPYDADLSCMATREDAIDAAMEATNAG